LSPNMQHAPPIYFFLSFIRMIFGKKYGSRISSSCSFLQYPANSSVLSPHLAWNYDTSTNGFAWLWEVSNTQMTSNKQIKKTFHSLCGFKRFKLYKANLKLKKFLYRCLFHLQLDLVSILVNYYYYYYYFSCCLAHFLTLAILVTLVNYRIILNNLLKKTLYVQKWKRC
jgi:hypothetical protein